MKIFAISIVKNEADVIRTNLLAAKTWAHKIFVLDNSSTDGTWEIVMSIADDVIIPWKQDPQPWYEGMRALVFNQFKHLAQKGDWWCFSLDSDELYKDDPKKFLSGIPFYYGQVYKRSIDFILTTEDVSNNNFDDVFDIQANKLSFISPTTWSELRFFKHTPRIVWPENRVKPLHLRAVYSKKIDVFHFQYRSPAQIQLRLKTRLDNKFNSVPKDGEPIWQHITQSSWNEYIADEKAGVWYKDETTLAQLKDTGFNPYPTVLHKFYNIVKSMAGVE